MKLPAWKVKNLRSTFVTGCLDLGLPPHVIALVTSHKLDSTLPGAMNHYAHGDLGAEQRHVLETWSSHLFPPPKGVVQLADRRKA